LAFSQDGYQAFTKKSQILKLDTSIYNFLIEYIKNGPLTFDDIIKIYMMFLKAENDKKNSEDKRTPIPYYLLNFIGNEFKNINDIELREKLNYIFSNKEIFDIIYKFYKSVTKRYKIDYKFLKGIEYNQMIKSAIDMNILYKTLSNEVEMLENKYEKKIINNFRNNAYKEIEQFI